LNDALRVSLEEFMEKAIAARFEFNTVEFGAGPVELHRALVESEVILTELENYLSRSMRAKSLLERKAATAKMEWQEAWDKAIAKVNRRPTLGEYATGKEKASEANLETFDETRKMRQAEEFLSFATEAVDVIRLHYYGLDKIRQNIRKRLDMSQTDYYG
jgi:hypothetical protein